MYSHILELKPSVSHICYQVSRQQKSIFCKGNKPIANITVVRGKQSAKPKHHKKIIVTNSCKAILFKLASEKLFMLFICSLQISGILHNTGQSLVFRVDKDTKQHVNISGGPLAYRYQFEEIYIHYGTENSQGSEHHIHGYSFPGEVCIHYLASFHSYPVHTAPSIFHS